MAGEAARPDASTLWRQRLGDLNVWRRGGERAVHKPLLLLLLLARAARGSANEASFLEVEKPLAELLREFGPPRSSVHPEYPFWHLQSDDVWVVRDGEALPLKKGGASPTKGTLRDRAATGYVPEDLWLVLRDDAALRGELSQGLLDTFWPTTLHSAIRSALGLEVESPTASRRPRDPAFREAVLTAYERRCAVCGFDGRLGREDLGLEAAHIRWHCYDGPDVVRNGLLLCSIHHVALDRGALGLAPELRWTVSKHFHGGEAAEAWLGRFHGRPLHQPRDPADHPALEHVAWHEREVFRSPARARSA